MCVCGVVVVGDKGGSSVASRAMCAPVTYTGIWQPRKGTRQSVTARIPTCRTGQPLTHHLPRAQSNMYPHMQCRHTTNHVVVAMRERTYQCTRAIDAPLQPIRRLLTKKRTIDPSPPFGTQPPQRGVGSRTIADTSRSMRTHPHVVSRWQPRRGTFQPLQGWRHTMGDNHAAQR